jgi:hypothetical protein
MTEDELHFQERVHSELRRYYTTTDAPTIAARHIVRTPVFLPWCRWDITRETLARVWRKR